MRLQKEKPLRSEKHRRLVAALPCSDCGRAGPSQAAHVNFNKGYGMKVCDSLTFPMCPQCHRAHDTGGIQRDVRRLREWEFVDAARAELLAVGQWSRDVEEHYQRAIQPLARVVGQEPPGKEKAT